MALRTKSEMRDKVRDYMRDQDDGNSNSEFTDTELDLYLEEAWDALFVYMASDPGGQALLRSVTAPEVTRQRVDQVKLPTDALGVIGMDVRNSTTLHAQLTTGTAQSVVATWNAVTAGAAVFYLDDRRWLVRNMDFSGAGDMDAVAAVIQAAIRSATGSTTYTCTWDSTNTKFIIKAYVSILDLEAPTAYINQGDATGETDITGTGFMNGTKGNTTLSMNAGNAPWVNMPMLPQPVVPGHSMSGLATQRANRSTVTGSPHSWSISAADGYINMWPIPSGTNDTFRIRYYIKPTFPSTDDDVPFGIVQELQPVVEYYTAALALQEELENQLPIGHFGQLFRMRYMRLVDGRVGGLRTKRTSIRREGY